MNTEQKTQTEEIKPEYVNTTNQTGKEVQNQVKPVREEYIKEKHVSIYITKDTDGVRLVWRGEFKIRLKDYKYMIVFSHVRDVPIDDFEDVEEFRKRVLNRLDGLDMSAMFEAVRVAHKAYKILETLQELEKEYGVGADIYTVNFITKKLLDNDVKGSVGVYSNT